MGKISKTHFRPYKEPANLQSHIDVLQVVIAALRDSELPLSSKKRMLNHALWEISHARGNFAPEFRSISVVRGLVGTKIERDHVYKRKHIVQDILENKKPLGTILDRVIHCVVTEDEHERLTKVPDNIDGWERYQMANVEVHSRQVRML